MQVSSLLVALCILALANALSPRDQFNLFKKNYGKSYASQEVEEQRYAVFKNNLDLIDEKNAFAAKQQSSAVFGINQFSDLSPAEFKQKYLSKTPAVRDPTWPVAAEYNQQIINDLPTDFDWRTKGAVTPVKNQGACGSCWSFSTTGNIEGQWFLAGNSLTSLSEQNLVDCDHECMQYENQTSCDAGCDGGLQPNAYSYVIKNKGIDTEASYPYSGADGSCSYKASNVGATIDNFTMVSSDEDQMAAYLVQHGPLAIAADAAEWQFYIGGVFDLPCGKSLDHGILIVGYGNETTIFGHKVNYWIVKNSWGPHWGEAGYLKVERGTGECGLNTFVSSSIINPKN